MQLHVLKLWHLTQLMMAFYTAFYFKCMYPLQQLNYKHPIGPEITSTLHHEPHALTHFNQSPCRTENGPQLSYAQKQYFVNDLFNSPNLKLPIRFGDQFSKFNAHQI